MCSIHSCIGHSITLCNICRKYRISLKFQHLDTCDTKGGKVIAKNTQSRKWLLTINNPQDKDYDHNRIISEIKKIKSCVYYCMSDEIGGKEKTHHTYIYLACKSGVRFSTIKNRFPVAHIEMARGTSEQNRDYVFKLGKYEKEKGNTKIAGTEEEYGVMPMERKGKAVEMI